MNSKERVLRAIKHQETDRIPVDFPVGSSHVIMSCRKTIIKVVKSKNIMKG